MEKNNVVSKLLPEAAIPESGHYCIDIGHLTWVLGTDRDAAEQAFERMQSQRSTTDILRFYQRHDKGEDTLRNGEGFGSIVVTPHNQIYWEASVHVRQGKAAIFFSTSSRDCFVCASSLRRLL